MKKPRSNSALERLPAEQKTQLEAWLFEENMSYRDAAERVRVEFQVETGKSAVGEFRQRCQQWRTWERIATRSARVTGANLAFRENPADTYAALSQIIGQLAFEAADDGDRPDVKQVKDLANLALEARAMELKEREIQQDERRVALLEKKGAQIAEAAKVVASGLSEEEKLVKIKQVRRLQNSGNMGRRRSHLRRFLMTKCSIALGGLLSGRFFAGQTVFSLLRYTPQAPRSGVGFPAGG